MVTEMVRLGITERTEEGLKILWKYGLMQTSIVGIGKVYSQKIKRRTVLSWNPLLSKRFFKSEISVMHKNGYYIRPSGMKRHCMYFCVEGNYPKWPIFIEPDGIDESGTGKQLRKNHSMLRCGLQQFYKRLRNRYSLLYHSVKEEETRTCKEISGGIITLYNMMNRVDSYDSADLYYEEGKILEAVCKMEELKLKQCNMERERMIAEKTEDQMEMYLHGEDDMDGNESYFTNTTEWKMLYQHLKLHSGEARHVNREFQFFR